MDTTAPLVGDEGPHLSAACARPPSEPSGYAQAVPFSVRGQREVARRYFEKLGAADVRPSEDGGGTDLRLGYQPAFEGLRAALLLLVVLTHTQQYLTGEVIYFPLGGLGIMPLFFMLSGFLIASIIIKNMQRSGSVQYRAFVWRRIQRLGIPMLLFVVVYFIFNVSVGEPVTTPSGSKILGVTESALLMLTFTINLAPTFGYSERYDSIQMWSLGVDMQLYLLLPVLLFLLLRSMTNLRKLLAVILTMFVVFQVLLIVEYYFLYYRLDDHSDFGAVAAQAGVYQRPENSAGAFLVGVGLYLVWSKGLMPVRLFKRIWIPVALIFAYSLAMFIPARTDFSFWIGFTLLSVLGTVIVGEAVREGSPIWRAFSGRIIRVVGRLSYTIYIWHMFVFINVNRWVDRDVNPYVRTLGAWTILGVVSVAAWWIAERPLLRLPPVRGPRRPDTQPATTASASGAEGGRA